MADIAQVKQAMMDEKLSLYRGFVLLSSMIAGMAVTLIIIMQFLNLPIKVDSIIGYLTVGLKTPYEPYKAIAVVGGGILGVFIGEWFWLLIGQLQRSVTALPSVVVLKRASIAFAPFLLFVTNLCLRQYFFIAPFFIAALLVVGFVLLAFFEKKDKRKVYFAYPTENRYQPASFFTHGSVIVLGTGVGWFLQSLTGVDFFVSFGTWFAVGCGIIIWMISLFLAYLVSLFYSKLTYDQVYLAVAFAAMPLAILPLQTLGGLTYIEYGKVVAVTKVAWLMPLLVSVTAFLCLSIIVLGLIRLRKQATEIVSAWEEMFRALMLIISVPILIYAVAYWPMGGAFSSHRLLGAVDMFAEGEPLGAAQAILMGRLPFNEILFRHGFLSDAISGLAAVNWFGGTLESYRLMLSYLAPLGLITIYIFAIFCMPWLWAVLLVLTLLTGSLGLVPYTRFLFPMVGFIFTLFYLQSNKWYLLIFSGVLTALSVIASYTAGVMAFAGQLSLLLVYVFVGNEIVKKRLTGLGIYLGATILGLMPWILYLAMSGSLGAYFNNFAWVMNHYGAVFGLPLPGVGESPSVFKLMIFAIPPIVIAIGGVHSIKAVFAKKEERHVPWNVLLLSVITGLYWMRFLNRSDYSFLLEALPIAAMLGVFFVYRLTVKQPRLKGAIFIALLPVLLIPQPSKMSLKELTDGFGNKTRIIVDGLTKPKSMLLGNVYLQPEQANNIDEMVNYLNEQVGTAESFFYFSNQPLLYFLVPRRPVTRTLSTINIATFDQQLETIHDLDANEVKMIINDGHDLKHAGLDQLPSELRQYAVSEYILNKYVPIKTIGNNVIMLLKDGELKPEKNSVNALKRKVNFHSLPLLMGEDSKYATGQGNSIDRFIAKGKAAVEAKGLTITSSGERIMVDEGMGQAVLTLESKDGNAGLGNVINMKLAVSEKLNGLTAELIWGQSSQNEGVKFTLKGDGKEHDYVFRVGGLPSWVLREKITKVQLIMPGGGWQWRSASCLKINDIAELKKK